MLKLEYVSFLESLTFYTSIVHDSVVFTQQKESSGKCLLCISIKQRIDNMYTQVAIHTFILSSSFSLLLDKLQFL